MGRTDGHVTHETRLRMPSEQTIRFHHWTGYYIEAVRRLHAVLSQCLLLADFVAKVVDGPEEQ
jgi:hypothetical protein